MPKLRFEFKTIKNSHYILLKQIEYIILNDNRYDKLEYKHLMI